LVVRDDERWKLHFKADTRYGKPKAYGFFQFTLSNQLFGEMTNPRTSALAKVFRMSLNDALNEYTYDASAAGLQYGLQFTTKGPEITFTGYNDKLPDFVKYIAKGIATHIPDDEAKFERFKDTIARDLEGFITDQPYRHAVLFSRIYTDAPAYTPLEVLKELKALTIKDVQQFAKGLWGKMYGEALVQGNLKKEEALSMVESMDKVSILLGFTP